MTRPSMLKMSLLGAFLSFGAIAANDPQTKRIKDNAEFVEKAAMASKTQVTLSELALSQSTNPAVKQFAEKVISDHQKAFDGLKSVAASKGISLPFASIGTGVHGMSGSATPGVKDESEAKANSKAEADKIAADAKKTGDEIAANESYGSKKAKEVVTSSPTIASSKEYTKAAEKLQGQYNDLTKLSGEKFDKQYLSDIGSTNDKAIKLVEKQSKDGWDSDLMTWSNEVLPTLKQHEEMVKSVTKDVKNARPSM